MNSKGEAEDLGSDLGARVPGLEQLAEIPGVVPQSEERAAGPGEPGFEAVFGDDAPKPVGRREFWLALLFFLACAAFPLRRGLASSERVVFGLDRAMVSLPWSAVVREKVAAGELEASEVALKNGGLSDQAVNFYPFYRWVSRSYLAGDMPWWNPLIYCGAPAAANPQSGVFDPQVWLLVAGEAIAGLAGFHYALALAALGRLLLAGLGAYLLARRLGLGGRGALLAGLTFQFSGYMVLWLNFPLGHVPPLLPWILFFIEGLSGTGPGETSPWPRRRAFVGVALAMLLAVLAGHPETSFFVGLTAGLWSLAMLLRDRRAGLAALAALALGSLIASPLLFAFWSYLSVSGAQAIRSAAQQHVDIAWLALGVLGLLFVLLRLARLAMHGPGDEDVASRRPLAKWAPALGLAASAALVAGGLLWFFTAGLEQRFFLTFIHDLWGQPGVGAGYRGPGTSLLESGSTFLLTAGFVGAIASIFAGAESACLRRRGLIVPLAAVSFALAVGLPGPLELFRQLPLIGLGDTVRFAPVAALMIGLLGGEALERAPLRARLAGVVVLAALLGVNLFTAGLAPTKHSSSVEAVAGARDLGDGFGLVRGPGQRLDARREQLEGWFPRGLGLTGVRLHLERFGPDPSGTPAESIDLPLDLLAAATIPGAAVPRGAQVFRASAFQTSRLSEGWWNLSLEFLGGPAYEVLGHKELGASLHRFDERPRPLTLLLLGAAALAFLFGRRAAPLVLALSLAQALTFAEGQNPDYPAAAVYPETRTEAILARELGAHRFFSEPGVMSPDTGLVRGLASLDGYDAIDPLSYNQTRVFALRPGVHPLLGWNVRGAALDSPIFQMLGVKCLVLRGPLGDVAGSAGWELIARPGANVPLEPAETWIYRARSPWPRAWCLTAAITPAEAEDDLAAWNPRTTGILLEPWAPANPATRTAASEPRSTNNRVELEVETDGDCLLVISDQYFAGAHFEVDGEPREALAINGLFIGVELHAGDREVVLLR